MSGTTCSQIGHNLCHAHAYLDAECVPLPLAPVSEPRGQEAGVGHSRDQPALAQRLYLTL